MTSYFCHSTSNITLAPSESYTFQCLLIIIWLFPCLAENVQDLINNFSHYLKFSIILAKTFSHVVLWDLFPSLLLKTTISKLTFDVDFSCSKISWLPLIIHIGNKNSAMLQKYIWLHKHEGKEDWRCNRYLHVSVYVWIRNNSSFLLPFTDLHHNIFIRPTTNGAVIIVTVVQWRDIITKSSIMWTLRNAYLLGFQHPDNALKNPVFPSQSYLECACHFD